MTISSPTGYTYTHAPDRLKVFYMLEIFDVGRGDRTNGRWMGTGNQIETPESRVVQIATFSIHAAALLQ